jgi:hypothetical protein
MNTSKKVQVVIRNGLFIKVDELVHTVNYSHIIIMVVENALIAVIIATAVWYRNLGPLQN